MNAETYIRKHIRKILSEQEEKKKSSIRSVGVGSGKFSFKIKEAGTLAEEDPALLMANLNVSQPKGKNDLDKLKSLLSSAATGTEEMKEVFAVPSSQPKAKNKGEDLESVTVKVSVIPMRNAMKYIEYTLIGATNAYGLKWDENIEVTQAGDSVVVWLR
jgi:hypothetical protein|tara:strand:- start:15224 stop:15700 length:477 start_codon:yes stop_codon:yes gene_type:complete